MAHQDQLGTIHSEDAELIRLLQKNVEPLRDLSDPNFDGLIERIGDSRIVLLGESTHGTEEFYRLRAEISLRLIREKGFRLIALEADWPDVEQVNAYVQGKREDWDGFHRFPEWMWRNTAFADFANELRKNNQTESTKPVSIYGLDLYSLHSSMQAVLKYLRERDPEKMRAVLEAHDCLSPYQEDPSLYGLAVWNEQIRPCEDEVFRLLRELHAEMGNAKSDRDTQLMSAMQNARVIKNAEEYYRIMYQGNVDSWNLRDQHMFETMNFLLDYHGSDSKIIVWEHNSHVGNAYATQMAAIGEHNVGQLVKEKYHEEAYIVGFLTDHGTVAAASRWGGQMEIKNLQPARSDSFEGLFHNVQPRNFALPLRNQLPEIIDELKRPRLERAVGVLYLPRTERSSHYFKAAIAEQFDEVIWLDETHAVEPLPFVAETEEPDTYPTGL